MTHETHQGQSPTTKPETNIQSPKSEKTPQSDSLWTTEEMVNVKPYPMPEVTEGRKLEEIQEDSEEAKLD